MRRLVAVCAPSTPVDASRPESLYDFRSMPFVSVSRRATLPAVPLKRPRRPMRPTRMRGLRRIAPRQRPIPGSTEQPREVEPNLRPRGRASADGPPVTAGSRSRPPRAPIRPPSALRCFVSLLLQSLCREYSKTSECAARPSSEPFCPLRARDAEPVCVRVPAGSQHRELCKTRVTAELRERPMRLPVLKGPLKVLIGRLARLDLANAE